MAVLSFMESACPSVRCERRGDLDVWVVNHPRAQATLTSQGAQLLDFAPSGSRPVVWLSDEVAYQRGQSLRGGVPICAPWFGALDRNPDAVRASYAGATPPAHGLVRGVEWLLDELSEDDAGVCMSFRLPADHPALAGWRERVSYRVTYRIGAELDIRLALTAESEATTASLALHTYLAASDVANVEVLGLEGTRFLDTLDGWRECVEDEPVQLRGEVDRVYLGVARPTVVRDRGWGREVEVRHASARSAILWNPHVEKTKRLSQMAPDAWRRMLCIETAAVLDDARRIEAGETLAIGVTLAVRSA